MFGINIKDLSKIRKKFEEKLENYSFNLIIHDEDDSFYVIEDSLILLYSEKIITEGKPIGVDDYATIHIRELTYNSINFKYNHSKFLRGLEEELSTKYLSVHFKYKKFRGFDRWYWAEDMESIPEYYNRIAPELELYERHQQWEGVEYHFIVMEFESTSGAKEPLVAYTTRLPYDYVKDYVKKSIKIKKPHGGDNLRGKYTAILRNFRSWKNLSVKDRLENKMTYFTISKNFKEKENIWRYADEILTNYRAHAYSEFVRHTYQTSDYRWISELRVFNLTKKLYPNKKVIFQHRPYFLRTDYGSQLSYDIFIPKLNIAIEYQGRQHYEPVDFFGGVENFLDTQRRDILKAELSYKNGIRLIYINYWEDLTIDLIERRINQAINFMS